MLEKNILLMFTERNNRSTGVPCFTWILCKRKRSGQIPFNSLWTLHLHKLALKWTCVARYISEKIRNLLSLYWPGCNFKFTAFGDLHLRPKKKTVNVPTLHVCILLNYFLGTRTLWSDWMLYDFKSWTQPEGLTEKMRPWTQKTTFCEEASVQLLHLLAFPVHLPRLVRYGAIFVSPRHG